METNQLRQKLLKELSFTASRSGGPGGQNVNKVSSKVTLKWRPEQTQALSVPHRERFLARYATKISREGLLLISSAESRDQSRNKERCIEKLLSLIQAVRFPPKKRKASKPPRAEKERRLKSKKLRASLKQGRRGPARDEN